MAEPPATSQAGPAVDGTPRKAPAAAQNLIYDPRETDPLLLAAHSELKSFTGRRLGFTYPKIRVFYRRHPKADELPTDPTPLPLLVFCHGLGGSVAQFHPLLTSLSNVASCLAVDLPGCGRSDFAPTSWDAYTSDALIDLLETVIDGYRDTDRDQPVVLIGHSMGSAMAARLANKAAPHATDLASHVLGVVGICPISGPVPEDKTVLFRRLLYIPTWIFDLWRMWDAWGGPNSASVKRFLGPGSDIEARKLQDRYNHQSRSGVFRRVAWGMLSTYVDGKPKGGLFGEATWDGLNIPVFLVGGSSDTVTSPKEVEKIATILDSKAPELASGTSSSSHSITDAAAPVNFNPKPSAHVPESIDDISEEDFAQKRALHHHEESFEDPTTPQDGISHIPPQPRHPAKVVKKLVLPPPANHALLYTPTTVRALAGVVCDFLNENITGRLSLGWQLQFLSKEGKWDVKNLAKWEKVAPISEPIAGVFRAMKTLREVDEVHCPKEFVKNWSHVIKDVVDISHDNPVYDPRGLEQGGIKYHKFPTVSKIPPSDQEVDTFVALIDRLREEQKKRAKEEDWDKDYVIGVHCHYGFNRTGYFVVCYLVDRCGFEVNQAIEEFAKRRPKGIKHTHFKDALAVRYSGLKKGEAPEGN